jgi:hypothetical protein
MASNSIEQYLDNSQPLVCISAECMEYIREIVDQCPDEVSWVMEVTELDNFIYEIDAVYLPRQKVNGATTEFDAEDIAHLLDNEPTFDPAKWRGWGHSHVNMGVTPSGQDKKMMQEFAKDCEFFVGMIHNKKGEVFCWVVDNTRKLFIRDVEVQIISKYENEIKDLLKKRVSKLVEPPKTETKGAYAGTGSYNGYTSTTPATKPAATDAGKTNYVPFYCLGREVCFAQKLHNGTSKFGFEIGGMFFPSSEFPTAHEAVVGYEKLLKLFEEDKWEEIEPVPPVHQMDIYDELEDYNRDVRSKSTF